MALISKFRFTIYDVYDADGACECELVWDNNYMFDKKLKSLGQINCLDFEESC